MRGNCVQIYASRFGRNLPFRNITKVTDLPKRCSKCAYRVILEHLRGRTGLGPMAPKRVMFTVSRKIDEFLDRKVEESGIDRSNLIRMKLWEWMEQDRDRAIAERQVVDLDRKRSR